MQDQHNPAANSDLGDSPLRKRGFEVGPGVVLFASRSSEGQWQVWAELDGRPMEWRGQPRIFEAATRFRAQCKAIRWLETAGYLRRDVADCLRQTS